MVLMILVLLSAIIASVTSISAIRAGLRLRRTRRELQTHLFSEVTQLVGRTTELEKNLAALEARAQALPIRISELQQNLATLLILTNALGASLRQIQRLLSFSGIKSSLAGPLAKAFGTRSERSSQNGHERRIEDSLP